MTGVVCLPQPLERFVHQVCLAVGADEDIAAEVAHHLVRANLSGHDSHGVLRLAWYVEQIGRGELLPGARPRVIRERGATAVFDAGRGFGQYTTMVALEWAMAAARRHGLGAAAIRRSMHIGRLGEYAERAAERGLIAITTYGTTGIGTGIVVPFGGRERFLGTNPWSIGIPAGGTDPMVFDAATSTIAEGKLRVARSKGAPAPQGCIVDKDGNPSTDPEDFYAGGALLPLGGAQGGHKGYSLAMAAAMLGGLAMIDDPDAALTGTAFAGDGGAGRGLVNGVITIILDPAAFGEREDYATMVGGALTAARQIPPAPGVAEVLAPGDPEVRSRATRGADGIPLPDAIWADLRGVAERHGVALPDVTKA